jgi:Vitamin K-dependent gamma-carboxylase
MAFLFMKKISEAVKSFFLKPLRAETLGLFRIAIGSFAIIQLLVLLPDWMWFFGPDGLMPWIVSDTLNTKNTPTLSDAAKLFSYAGVSGNGTVYIITSIYAISLLMLVAGIYTRLSAFFAWLCHMMLNATGHMTAYGVETFTHIALFYCMVLPAGAAFSIDRRRGKYQNIPGYLITLSIRLVQLHLCIMYLSSGIEKAMGTQWWNGQAVWMTLQQDQFHRFETGWLANVPIIPKVLGWATLVAEILYPLGIYWKKTKKFWLIAICGMHLFITVFLGLYLFGALMILLNITAFGYHCFPILFEKKLTGIFFKKKQYRPLY